MSVWTISSIILLVLIAIVGFLYYQGNKLQKKQAEQREQMAENSQNVTMLIIDKKKLPLKDSGLPPMVIEQAPKRYRRSKIPVVKVKMGPRIMNMMTDEEVYDQIPIKTEVRAQISGIYITGIKNYKNAPVPEPEKKGLLSKLGSKAMKASNEAAEERKAKQEKKAKKK